MTESSVAETDEDTPPGPPPYVILKFTRGGRWIVQGNGVRGGGDLVVVPDTGAAHFTDVDLDKCSKETLASVIAGALGAADRLPQDDDGNITLAKTTKTELAKLALVALAELNQ